MDAAMNNQEILAMIRQEIAANNAAQEQARSFSNGTTNFGLPQWEPNDKPTFLVDMNSAYRTIDTQMQANKNDADSAITAAESANTLSNQALTASRENAQNIVTLTNNLSTTNTQLTTLTNNLSTINTQLSTLTDSFSGGAFNGTKGEIPNVTISNSITHYQKFPNALLLSYTTNLSATSGTTIPANSLVCSWPIPITLTKSNNKVNLAAFSNENTPQLILIKVNISENNVSLYIAQSVAFPPNSTTMKLIVNTLIG